MTDEDTRPKMPSWLLATIGGMILFWIVMWIMATADQATYFGFDHAFQIEIEALLVWPPFACVCVRLAWIYDQRKRSSTERVFTSLITGSTFAGFIISAFAMLATRIDHAVLFPAATTRTLTGVEAPIAKVYAKHGKGGGWFIALPPVSDSIRITHHDFTSMLVGSRRHYPMLNSDRFPAISRWCAHVTIQLSGASGRLLHAGESALPVGAIHPCPARYDDVFARLP
jgi:hypothetical protein